jgi:hypothetical protein
MMDRRTEAEEGLLFCIQSQDAKLKKDAANTGETRHVSCFQGPCGLIAGPQQIQRVLGFISWSEVLHG